MEIIDWVQTNEKRIYGIGKYVEGIAGYELCRERKSEPKLCTPNGTHAGMEPFRQVML